MGYSKDCNGKRTILVGIIWYFELKQKFFLQNLDVIEIVLLNRSRPMFMSSNVKIYFLVFCNEMDHTLRPLPRICYHQRPFLSVSDV